MQCKHLLVILVGLATGLGSCKAKKRVSADEIDDAAPKASDNGSEVATTADLYGDALPQGAIARFGSLRMVDRSLRNMIFSADGRLAISNHRDGYQVWNLSDAKRDRLLLDETVSDIMAMSSDGKQLATAVDGTGSLQLWDFDAGRITKTLDAHPTEIIALCYLGSSLVTASAKTIKRWNLETFEAIEVARSSSLSALACAAKGDWIAFGTREGEALIAPEEGEVVKLGRAKRRITTISISPDSSRFAFGSADESILLWSPPKPGKKAGKPVVIAAHDKHTARLAFSSDGQRLFSSGGDWWFRIWNPKNGEMLEEIPGVDGLEGQLMTLSPDNTMMISWSQHGKERGSEAGRWWLWDAKSGELLLEPIRHRGPLTAIRFSPNGEMLATAGDDRTVRLWDPATGKENDRLDGAEGSVNAIAFSNEGLTLLSAGTGAKLRAWNWKTGDEKTLVKAMGGVVTAIDLLPKEHFVSGNEAGQIWSWDMKTGAQAQGYEREDLATIHDLAVSPDGKLLAIVGGSPNVYVVEINGGKEVAVLTTGTETAANLTVRFSPDGQHLAVGADDSKIRIWTTSDWASSATLEGHDGTVRCLDFSPDSHTLVSGGNDEQLRVWDLGTAKEKATFLGHQDVIVDVAISPDGKTVASASGDRTALLWPLPQ